MGKRPKNTRYRLSVDEHDLMTDTFLAAKPGVSFTDYFRQICLGDKSHPAFNKGTAENNPQTTNVTDVSNVGKVKGSAETRHHIQAMILAADMIRIKEDPPYQQIIKQSSKEFKALVDAVRGYKFAETTMTKSPLRREFERHRR